MKFRLPFAVAVVASTLTVPAFAAENTPAAQTVAAPIVETPAAGTAAPAPARTRQRSPLSVAIAAALETEKQAMAALETQLAATKDAATIAAINGQIEQLKIDSEVQLLTLQAVHHRGAGRTAVAEQLEAAIRDMKAPPRTFTPASRPAPSGRAE